jgi:hypothetical protein
MDFLAAIQGGGEMFAGFADFFSRHLGGGGHQGTCIFGERAHVTAGCLSWFVHLVRLFLYVGDIHWQIHWVDPMDRFRRGRHIQNRIVSQVFALCLWFHLH